MGLADQAASGQSGVMYNEDMMGETSSCFVVSFNLVATDETSNQRHGPTDISPPVQVRQE